MKSSDKQSMPAYLYISSWVAMAPFCFLAVGGSLPWERPAGFLQGMQEQAASSPTKQMLTLIVSLILITLIARAWPAVWRGCKQAKAMCLLTALSSASVCWSQDPGTTAKKGVLLLLSTLFAVYVAQRWSSERQMQLIMMLGVITAILTVVAALAFPQFGLDQTHHQGAWQGIYGQKNQCARLTLFMLTPVFFRERARSLKDKALRISYGLFLAGVIVMTGSVTTLILLFLLTVTIFGVRLIHRFAVKERVAIYLTIFISICLLAGLVYISVASIVKLLGRDMTMTGRSDVWAAVVVSILKRPLLGYGYSAFWGVPGESQNVVAAVQWQVMYSHNGYLDVFLQLGGVGLCLFVLALIGALKNVRAILALRTDRAVCWYVSIILLTLVINLDEGTLLLPSELPYNMFCLACAALATTASRRRLIAVTLNSTRRKKLEQVAA